MRLLGPALSNGFTMAGAMWCVWYLLHLTASQPAPAVQGGVILAAMVISGVWVGRLVARRSAIVVGVASGVVCGCVNLLWVVSYLTSSSAGSSIAPDAAAQTTLHPSTGLFVVGFIAMCAVAGGIVTAIGSFLFGKSDTDREVDWHTRFAAVSAVLVFPLLMIGALVTSTGSGLAVPDWPGTYGTNMIMYPIGLMTRPRIVVEHGHRLFGMLIGLTTTVLMLQSLFTRRPRVFKVWAVALFLLVSVQGYLGGRRVTDTSQWLAVVHGVTAQVFFALMVGYAVAVSRGFRREVIESASQRVTKSESHEVKESGSQGNTGGGDELGLAAQREVRRLKVFATATTHSLLLQLILGAMYRHLRAPHALWGHIGFSIVVVIAATAAGFIAIRTSANLANTGVSRLIRRLGTGLVAVVFLQFLLGWAAFWVVQTTDREVTPTEQATTAPQVPVHAAALPTLHQANGAALLALATMTYAWSMRLKRAAH